MRSSVCAFLAILLSTSAAARAFAAAGLTPLGDLPGGEVNSSAGGVSDDGFVIVGSSVSVSFPGGFSHSQAFRWTSDGGMVGLGDLPGGDLFYSVAEGVSGDGSIVVGVGSSGFFRPFRWTRDGGMVDLGDVPAGSFSIGARGVSGDGSVVVGASTYFTPFEPAQRAIYWTADGGMRALWDVLLSHGVDPAADGWTELGSAEDISADGNTIVGYGTRNGATEAFVVDIPIIPEPAGDFDHDGDVDGEDLLQWQGDFGQNDSSDADGADFLAWQLQLGTISVRSAASAVVPEPAAGALALLGESSILLLRRRSLLTRS